MTTKINAPILQMGFRPFFLGATIYATIAIALWMLIYIYKISFSQIANHNVIYWHAHEMIFGYAGAVIAGFLLTAVRNWTGLETIQNYKLLFVFFLWVSARIAYFIAPMFIVACFDVSFYIALLISVGHPLYLAQKWQQMALVCSKLTFLLIGNILFFMGVYQIVPRGQHYGVYLGLYLIIALVLTIGRRVIPFFTQRGVGYEVELKNSKSLDVICLILFLLFVIADLYDPYANYTAIISLLLALSHTKRLIGWYTAGILTRPLLWVLYMAYIWIICGFVLKIFSIWGNISAFIAIHAFAYGGIGLITTGMMARVILGHTGRNVHQPPRFVSLIFLSLFVGAVARVFGPIIFPTYYLDHIFLSQILWLIAFLIFLIIYIPMLISPRIDGSPG